jgi:hypothetical protein
MAGAVLLQSTTPSTVSILPREGESLIGDKFIANGIINDLIIRGLAGDGATMCARADNGMNQLSEKTLGAVPDLVTLRRLRRADW